MMYPTRTPNFYRFFRRWPLVAILAVGMPLVAPNHGLAGGYFLQILARTGDTISGATLFSIRGFPAINDRGEVIFKARTGVDVQTSQGLFTPDALLVEIGAVIDGKEILDLDAGSVGAPVRLNNLGVALFRARFSDANGTDWGFFTQHELLVGPGHQIGGITLTVLGGFPDFNDNSTATFRSSFDDGSTSSRFGVFTQDRLVAAVGDVVDGQTLTAVTISSLSSSGRVAFGGQFSTDVDFFSGGNFIENELIAKEGDEAGGEILRMLFPPVINVRDDIAYVALFEAPVGSSPQGIILNERKIAGPGIVIDGKVLANSSSIQPALNDSGEVAFVSRFDVDGIPSGVGLFTEDRLVVANGDAIGSMTIEQLDFSGILQMNNRGQMVFTAKFTDQSRAVILATPLRPTLLTELVDDLVTSGVLDSQQGNVLIAKVEDAEKHLEQERTHTAINQLEAFINKVGSLVNSGELSPEDGQLLVDAAEQLIAELEA